MNYESFTPKMDIEIPPLEEIDVDQYFSKEELAIIGDYEKLRYKNIVRNYLTMMCFGMPVSKPEFMNGPRRKMKVMMPVDSDSDEEDWTPSLARKKEKEKLPPAPFKFVPPKKPIVVKKKVKEVDKTKPVSDKKGAKPQREKKSTKKRATATVSRPPVELALKNMIMKAAAPSPEEPARKKAKVAAATGAARYPRRNKERKNYKELEVPDEDIFLFCEECQKEYAGDCPVHGPLTIIKDKEVPPTKRPDPNHARLTTPDGLVIEDSKIPGAGLGVISNMAIPEGVRFGPYKGEIVHNVDLASDSGYAWQIYKDDKPHHYVDAKDPAKSNWLRYFNCARNEGEQNLVAFQYKGEIYYKTIQVIYPGQELLVFYGQAYAKELGIEATKEVVQKRTHDKVFTTSETGVPEYRCPFCILSLAYKLPNVLMTHVAKKHLDTDPEDVTTLMEQLYKRDSIYQINKTAQLRQTPAGDEVTFKQAAGYEDVGSSTGVSVADHDDRRNVEMWESHVETIEKRFRCKLCGKESISRANLERHMMIHTGEKPFKCDHCGKRFNRSCSLQTHMRIHTGEKPFKCDHCGKRFTENSDLQKHMMIHTGEKPFKCDHCGKAFNRSCSLQKHMRIHTGEKPFKCDHCGKGFNQSGHLQKHMMIHTGEKPFKCDHCGKGFNQSGHLQKHMGIHTGEKPHKCDHCGKEFNQKGHLQKHMGIHTGEKSFKCDHCGKGFNQSGHLQGHMMIHTGEKPFKCDHCGEGFTDSGNLQNHMRIHTGEKPYKCDHCGKGFNQSQHLQTHMRIHTGEKPFKCVHCGKGFNQSSDLQTHMRIHTGEKPYKCEHCNKQFTRRDSMKSHSTKHHGILNNNEQ